ncbi:class I adenylate-forming enzyme family protein [Actinomadura chibensis]|uniref:Long-chain fatty acid--CoA ligase n=1 Tax=Actinomadura chibensis TaxID=392828 RepID=A0A5D0NDW7_9ACTN|nr:AMP-binding protein [Actinomadura chibensis]TYB42489.1 long-chain fatty acid--CoA ligase [Actinomadura chibensis]
MDLTCPAEWLPRWTRLRPAAPALTWDGGSWTWADLAERVDRACRALESRGVGRGRRVGVSVSNRPEMVVAFLAVTRLGGVFVPLNPRLSAAEVAVVVDDCAPCLLVGEAGGLDALPSGVPVAAVEDLLAGGPAAPISAVLPGPEDTIALLYTSGTTGRPKGAVLTHRAFAATAENSRRALDLTPDDRHLIVSPLSFTGGVLTSLQPALATGGQVLVERGFDAGRVLHVLRTERPTVFMAVPAMLALLARHPGFSPDALSSLRYLGSGSAPVPPALFETYRRAGVEIGHAYGLTEGGGLGAVLRPAEAAAHPGSAGRPCALVELRIADERGVPRPAGTVGEIQQRGPSVMTEYWGRPDDTREALLPGGWLRTGDLGRIDGDGYLTVVGRSKDVILSGGINVYPAEVEAVIARHPDVVEAAVAGVPHEVFGETVAAFVVARPGRAPFPDELRDFCSGALADYKIPKVFHWPDVLPRTASGKIVRTALR